MSSATTSHREDYLGSASPELTEVNMIEVTKISDADRLRAITEHGYAHITNIERALPHAHDLVHGCLARYVRTLNERLCGLKAMENDLSAIKPVALAYLEHFEILALPGTGR